MLLPVVLGAAAAAGTTNFWSQRPEIVRQLSNAAGGSGPGANWRAEWERDFVWDSTAQVLYRRVGQGLRRCLEEEAELHNLVKEMACGATPMRAPAIHAALRPLYWPVSLPAIRELFARGGICRSAALRAAYKDYSRRHNAAIADPNSPSSKFLVYQICCGQLGNRIQSLVAGFLMALLSGRIFLVSWPVSPGLSNETVSDLFEIPRGLVAWEAEHVFAQLSKHEIENSQHHLPLHHAQLSEGWGELLCSNLTETYTSKFLIVESNQYFAPALALNGHYTETVRELFTREAFTLVQTPGSNGGGEHESAEVRETRSLSEEEKSSTATTKMSQKRKKMTKQKKRGGVGTSMAHRPHHRAPLPLRTLDIFGALSPLILRPTADLRKQMQSFGRDHLGVGEIATNGFTGSNTNDDSAADNPVTPPYTVGIQLRTKDRHPMSDRQIDAFLSCAKAAAMASSAASGSERWQRLSGDDTDAPLQTSPVIFLATDRPALRQVLKKRHGLDGRDGAPLLVWWDAPVATDVSGMHGALLDLWLLGFADEMYMSHGSTFGYVAHGRVGVPPSIVSKTGSCVTEISAEPCMHVWPFLRLSAQCFNKTTMSPWFSRELCHPFDTELVEWVDAANPEMPLSPLL